MSMLRSMKRAMTETRAGPDHTFSSSDTDIDVFGGTNNESGTVINEDRALQISTFYEAIDMISSDIAKLPFDTYDKAEGGRTKVKTNASYRLLKKAPNDYTNPYDFKKTLVANVLIAGNGYSYIVRDGSAKPTELIWLNPNETEPFKVFDKETKKFKVWYSTTLDDGRRLTFPSDDVIHIKGLSPDGLKGYNIISRARQSLGQAFSAQAYGNNFFKNDASGHVVLTTDKKLSVEAINNLRESWERMRRGVGNFHKTAVLHDGIKIEQVSLSAKDAQLLETRKWSIRDIASWFRMPPHKLGDDSRVSYSSLEQENQSYLDQCIDPWLVTMEEEFSRKLLTTRDYFGDTRFIEANRNALLRADTTTRFTAYNQAIQTGFMNRDEVRERENLNPMPDKLGQSFYTPLNVTLTPDPEIDGSAPGNVEDPDDDDTSDDERNVRAMFNSTIGRIVKRWEGMLVRSLKNHTTLDLAVAEHSKNLKESREALNAELKPFADMAGVNAESLATALSDTYLQHLATRGRVDLNSVVTRSTVDKIIAKGLKI